MRFVLRRLALGAAIALAGMAAAPAAQAQFGISNFTAQIFADDTRDAQGVWLVDESYTNSGGAPTDAYPVPGTGTGVYNLAGGHPYVGVVDFSFLRAGGTTGPPAGQNVSNLRVDIPRGLQPNPEAFDTCTDTELDSLSCPVDSQIGVQELTIYIAALAAFGGDIKLRIPLYNMEPLNNPEDTPRQDVVARFAFNPAEAAEAVATIPPMSPLAPLLALVPGLQALHPVHIVGGVRDQPSQFGPHDDGLYFTIDHLPAHDSGNPASPGVIRSDLIFWGVPGDPAHDAERDASCAIIPPNGPNNICTVLGNGGSAPSADQPFLTAPTECAGKPLVSSLTVWSHSDESDSEDDLTPTIAGQDGALHCENDPFAPTFDLLADVTTPDTPSGPTVQIGTPQPGLADKDEFSTSHVKDITVTLPQGMTLNPSVANGLETCTDAQFAAGVGVPGGETCPAASKVGDSSVVTPVLPPLPDDPSADLKGAAYVGQPVSGDKYRLFVTLAGREVSLRLKGSLQLNPDTGQVTARFPSNPQLPFSELDVDFRDGPRAPLATPLDCGPRAGSALMTAWSGHAPVTAVGTPFTIAGDGCPTPFAPTLEASVANPAAGAYSRLSVGVRRGDRNQLLSGVRVEVPTGFAGFVSRVAKCPQSRAAAGACPAASRVGYIDTAAGAGAEPYRLTGDVYLTEKYAQGSSFGLVSVVRAIAGPYDLGTVVVRQSLFFDPDDGHITVTGDQLPRILDGVPIRLRMARVNIDRSRFAFNPTACGPKRTTGLLHSPRGAAAAVQAPAIQISGCDRLGFKPTLSLKITGRRIQTAKGRHPGLKAVLKHRFGQSNIKGTKVTLPRSLALDPENARALCSYERGLAATCPASTRIGRARVVTPVLDKPLTGKVFFVQGIRFTPEGRRIRTLPTLLVKLRGEVRVNLRATSEVDAQGRLVSNFSDTPDVPFKRFEMVLKGGSGGILAATGRPSICRSKQVARIRMTGHAGKSVGGRLTLKRACKR